MIKIVFFNEHRKGIKPTDKFIEIEKECFAQIDYQGVIWFEDRIITLIEYWNGDS